MGAEERSRVLQVSRWMAPATVTVGTSQHSVKRPRAARKAGTETHSVQKGEEGQVNIT